MTRTVWAIPWDEKTACPDDLHNLRSSSGNCGSTRFQVESPEPRLSRIEQGTSLIAAQVAVIKIFEPPAHPVESVVFESKAAGRFAKRLAQRRIAKNPVNCPRQRLCIFGWHQQ